MPALPPPRPRPRIVAPPPFEEEETLEYRFESPTPEPSNADLLSAFQAGFHETNTKISGVEQRMGHLEGRVDQALSAQDKKIAEQAATIASWKTKALVAASALASSPGWLPALLEAGKKAFGK